MSATITASLSSSDPARLSSSIPDVPVINPGGASGLLWLIEIGIGGFTSTLVVEAYDVEEAIDEVTRHPKHGAPLRVLDCERADYDEDSAYYNSDGTLCDLEWISIVAIDKTMRCRYHGMVEGIPLPSSGVDPEKFDEVAQACMVLAGAGADQTDWRAHAMALGELCARFLRQEKSRNVASYRSILAGPPDSAILNALDHLPDRVDWLR